ncbi:hypothetical protein OPS25_06770 [Alteromonas ponticola]|uniref:Sulfotransferase domain-containing protein n=1 Tax=Alteromonas aquimaris TaxID=2998417 RepID=A0ABT3P602_9ALTE|nr:hypothetical protein [Alteromonas aquimaris]MCW8108194.1 hypothetical protein [Alteromonas aquimaris]
MHVYIHAGTYKTASTAIQQTLYSLRTNLIKQKILYPTAGISAQAEEIGYRHSRFVYEYGLLAWDAEVDKLKAEIRTHKPDLLILSSEAWSKPKGTKRLLALLEKLEAFNVTRVDVTFVVRNAYDYSVSFYREFVRRWGQRRGYSDYTNKRIPYYDYNNLFLPFISEPKFRMNFLPYCDDSVLHVLSAMGIEQHTPSIARAVNSSLSTLDVEIQRRINILTRSKAHPSPSANELFSNIGVKLVQDKIIEDTPPASLNHLYSDAYQDKFTALTGLSRDLLRIEQSRYFTNNKVPLRLFEPILDHLLPLPAKR